MLHKVYEVSTVACFPKDKAQRITLGQIRSHLDHAIEHKVTDRLLYTRNAHGGKLQNCSFKGESWQVLGGLLSNATAVDRIAVKVKSAIGVL